MHSDRATEGLGSTVRIHHRSIARQPLIVVDQWHRERYLESFLGISFGQNELSLAGTPESVDLAFVFDPDLVAAASQGFEPNHFERLRCVGADVHGLQSGVRRFAGHWDAGRWDASGKVSVGLGRASGLLNGFSAVIGRLAGWHEMVDPSSGSRYNGSGMDMRFGGVPPVRSPCSSECLVKTDLTQCT